MKKHFRMGKMMSLLLVVSMLLCMVPAAVWADDSGISLTDIASGDDNQSGEPAADGESELAKYEDCLKISAELAEGSVISLLKDGETPSNDFTVSYETDTNDYITGGAELVLAKQNGTFSTAVIPVTVKIVDGSDHSFQKSVSLILPVAEEKYTEIIDQIAVSLTESSDSWTVMDMKAYGTLTDKTAATSEEALQNTLNLCIAAAGKKDGSVYASDRARLEIVLRSMGIDSTKLYSVNSNTAIDNAEALRALDMASGGHYAAPWILLADLQGNLKLTDEQRGTLVTLLKDNVGSGMFPYEYSGVSYNDPDTAGNALAALASLYQTNEDAKFIADQILSAIPSALDTKGSLGNANSDAMMLIGLIAMGEDPQGYAASSGATLVDGMLSYVNEDGDAFQFPSWTTGAMEDNALATEQAFRALIAIEKAGGSAFNIYDFSAAAVQPGRATGEGQVEHPDPEPSEGSDIKVTLTIKADSGIWLPKTEIKVKKGSTVYHAFTKALSQSSGISAEGAAAGYVRSITKDGKTLAEFDKGVNSGWLYNVNDETPNVPLTKYVLEDGDDIVWFYSADYQKDPSIKHSSSGGVSDTALAELGGTIADENSFTDIKNHWAADAIRFAVEQKLFAGATATTFEPDAEMSRGMLVTVLWKLEGGAAKKAENVPQFTDVKADAYYAAAVEWARANDIVAGYSETVFAPEEHVTREQMAVILFRYARQKGYDVSVSADLSAYADNDSISAYALDAMKWVNAAGLISGRSKTVLAPQGEATRAEVAAIMQHFVQNVQSKKATD